MPHEAEARIEIRIDGKPFTEYLYRPALKKPILYPLRTDRGVTITRGYPLDPRPGERVDHPHHSGLWFNYGHVNGVDFWNNGEHNRRSAEMGQVVHRAVRKAEGGKDRGTLDVEMEWVMPDGTAVLREETRFVFTKKKDARIIDRFAKLTALVDRVSLADNKEGLLGLRVVRALEHATGKPTALTGADGKPGPERLDEASVTGRYITSEGKTGAAAWGTRGRWTALEGKVEGEEVTVVIFDHPKNPGHPTYWHARDYGLFAANNLGQAAFSEGKEKLDYALAKGDSAWFRYRILILSGHEPAKTIDEAYERFTRETE